MLPRTPATSVEDKELQFQMLHGHFFLMIFFLSIKSVLIDLVPTQLEIQLQTWHQRGELESDWTCASHLHDTVQKQHHRHAMFCLVGAHTHTRVHAHTHTYAPEILADCPVRWYKNIYTLPPLHHQSSQTNELLSEERAATHHTLQCIHPIIHPFIHPSLHSSLGREQVPHADHCAS